MKSIFWWEYVTYYTHIVHIFWLLCFSSSVEKCGNMCILVKTTFIRHALHKSLFESWSMCCSCVFLESLNSQSIFEIELISC